MSYLLAPLGLALVVTAIIDVLQTVLAVSGTGGLVTSRVSRWLWTLSLRLLPGRHKALRIAGMTIVCSVIAIWITLAWAGWSVFYNAAPGAVIHESGTPANAFERVYFAGETLFTLGAGEYRPVGPIFQFMAILSTANGLLLVTLAITYLVPITEAATQKRQLAAYISALGTNPRDLLVRAWNGQDFAGLDGHLYTIMPLINDLGQRHLSYPVLHYFHGGQPYLATAPSIALLDEALSIMRHALPPECQPEPAVLEPVRRALVEYLETLEGAFIEVARDDPQLPDLQPLREAGLPMLDDETFHRAIDQDSRRRRLLLALVHDDGWSWHNVYDYEGPEHLEPAIR